MCGFRCVRTCAPLIVKTPNNRRLAAFDGADLGEHVRTKAAIGTTCPTAHGRQGRAAGIASPARGVVSGSAAGAGNSITLQTTRFTLSDFASPLCPPSGLLAHRHANGDRGRPVAGLCHQDRGRPEDPRCCPGGPRVGCGYAGEPGQLPCPDCERRDAPGPPLPTMPPTRRCSTVRAPAGVDWESSPAASTSTTVHFLS